MHEFQESAIVLVNLEGMDHRRRINEVQILRKFLFLDGSLIRLHVRVHFGKSGIVEFVYGCLEMEPIQRKNWNRNKDAS